MKSLILYGAQNLTNKKMTLSRANGLKGFTSTTQRINNARFSGSTVVDKKVDERRIRFYGALHATDDLDLQEVWNEYSRALDKEDRYLRVCNNYLVFTSLTDGTGWQFSGDTTTTEFDEEIFQYANGSIKFNADISEANGYTEIYTTTGTAADISSYGNSGNFELWIYLPQTTGVSNIELRIGNDSSNYYSSTATSQYDGEDLEVGWNYISYRVFDVAETGTVDPYSFGDYVDIRVNYNGEMEDRDDFRLGGVLWTEETKIRNYRSYIEDFVVSSEHYDITRADAEIAVIAYEGVSESTGEFNADASSNNTTATVTGEIDLEGTYEPLPTFQVNVNSATNISALTLSNTTNGDSVTITRTYSAGDVLLIDTDNREVTVNGGAVDYDDVLPRFVLGENDYQISWQSTAEESVEKETQDVNLTSEI